MPRVPGGACVGRGSMFGAFRNSEGWFKHGATSLGLHPGSSCLSDLRKVT